MYRIVKQVTCRLTLSPYHIDFMSQDSPEFHVKLIHERFDRCFQKRLYIASDTWMDSNMTIASLAMVSRFPTRHRLAKQDSPISHDKLLE